MRSRTDLPIPAIRGATIPRGVLGVALLPVLVLAVLAAAALSLSAARMSPVEMPKSE